MRLIDRYYGICVWILSGICAAAAVSLMFISGTFRLDRFYDVGAVYDTQKSDLTLNGNDTMYYDQAKQVWVVTAETAVKGIGAEERGWKYIYMPLSNVSTGSFDALLTFYDASYAQVYELETVLSEGDNLIKVPKGIRYEAFHITITDQVGLSFSIDQVQLRTKKPVSSKHSFPKYFLCAFAGYLFITGILLAVFGRYLKKIPWYAPVYGLQSLFLYAGGYGEWLCGRIPAKKRALIRRGLFAFVFLLMQVSFILGIYNKKFKFHCLALVCVLALLFAALLCWERPLKRLNWRNKLVASWMGLWALSMVSDLIVAKRYSLMGYAMVFGMGFLFFMWGNMRCRKDLLTDFIRGIIWSFWPNLLFCWLFRPYLPGYRYMGATYSPGIFGLYLLFAGLAFLAELKFDRRDTEALRGDLWRILALGICADLMWKTQSISSMLPMAAAVVLFSLKLWICRRQVRLLGLALYLLVFCAGFAADSNAVYHIPRLLNTEVKFEKDFYLDTITDHPFTMPVQAAEEGNENRLLYKLTHSTSLESLTTGRTVYWKAYLRELNLWGHKHMAHFLGANRMPHNGYLAMMYRYGIFAAVPYILMVLFNLWFAFRYFRRHLFGDEYAFFVLADMLCCFLLLFVENLELPFGWVCWYGMYVVMGIYFDDEKARETD